MGKSDPNSGKKSIETARVSPDVGFSRYDFKTLINIFKKLKEPLFMN